MVGFDPEKVELSPRWYATAGAASGIMTRVVLQPLDVVKIRFQLQEEPIVKGSSSKYHGIRQAVSTIIKEEGTLALWKGHSPAQVLSILYGIVQFGSFEVLTKSFWFHLPSFVTSELKPVTHFMCGGLSGCAATLACQPFDVIRTRFVAQGNAKVYSNMVHAGLSITQADGIKGLYRGLVPTLIQIAPQTGFQFGFYSLFKMTWDSFLHPANRDRESPVKSLICGALAGICAKTAVYPLDLLKKRLQVQGFGDARKAFGRTSSYHGFIHCLTTVAREEGMTGLFKGLRPSLIKAMFSVALHFCAYEQVLNLIRSSHTKISSSEM